ncbi:MAG TPA: hypothetical protein VKI62_01855, partial [Bacteroidota bacterium]|nr:hypothetical protein [Bacteroidota bacterium]
MSIEVAVLTHGLAHESIDVLSSFFNFDLPESILDAQSNEFIALSNDINRICFPAFPLQLSTFVPSVNSLDSEIGRKTALSKLQRASSDFISFCHPFMRQFGVLASELEVLADKSGDLNAVVLALADYVDRSFLWDTVASADMMLWLQDFRIELRSDGWREGHDTIEHMYCQQFESKFSKEAALRFATACGFDEEVVLLIRKSANVNEMDRKGDTALQIAARNG